MVTLQPHVRQAVFQKLNIDVETASVFTRAIVKKETYYSRCYYWTKMRNSYTVEYMDNGVQRFGFINFFISLQSLTIVVLTPLIRTSSFCYPNILTSLSSRIIPVCVDLSTTVILAECLVQKCVCIDFGGATYIAKPPNSVYSD